MFKAEPSNMTPEIRLLLACSRGCITAEDSERIVMLTSGPIDWNSFNRLVEKHRVYPMVHRNLGRLAENGVPGHVRQFLGDCFEKNARRALKLTAELVRLLKMLEQNGVPSLALKGPVLALQIYGDLCLRHAGDLDLLVAPQNVRRAEYILYQEGYRRVTPDFGLTPRQHMVYMRQQHHFGYYHDERQISVELHWRWTSIPYLFALDIDQIRKGHQFMTVGGTQVQTLSIEDLLLYLCTHGGQHAWTHLLWVLDIAELLRKSRAINWAQVMERAAKYGVRRPLVQALVLSNRLFGSPLPGQVLGCSRRDRAVPSLVRLAFRIIMKPSDPPFRPFTCAYILSKYHGLRLHKDMRFKLKVCLKQISPIPLEWRIVPLPDALFPLYYVIRPFIWFWRWLHLQGSTDGHRGGRL